MDFSGDSVDKEVTFTHAGDNFILLKEIQIYKTFLATQWIID